MSLPQSVADTHLGLTAAEIQLFRHEQQIAAQGHASQAQAGRGRGQSRSSAPGSRAASAASSGQGRIFLDHNNLERLLSHFGRLMQTVQDRLDDLEDATERSVQAFQNRASSAMQDTDAEMAKLRRMQQAMTSLEDKMEQVRKICGVIQQLRIRVDDVDRRMDQRTGHNHSQAARRR